MEHQDRCLLFMSIPGLRRDDLSQMPRLSRRLREGNAATLLHSFPTVTWPTQATMLTGKLPSKHGVIANGFYDREKREVEMWTAGNEVIEAPQIWDALHQQDAGLTSGAWFPMLSKRSGADCVCMPAPVHNPDGSESLWCYTKPSEYYGELLAEFEHFPLQHFWGPMANIASTTWIAQSACHALQRFHPKFFYLYLPHLDYAAQRSGPDSAEAQQALTELDGVLGQMDDYLRQHVSQEMRWMVASEYVIRDVDHFVCPNRMLREAGLLAVERRDGHEYLDFTQSRAWALVDHQFSHVFVPAPGDVPKVEQVFANAEGIAQVLVGDQLKDVGMNHSRSGEVLLISEPGSWQAYYWWLDDALAPGFCRTVDIHRKPGYDPVELSWDREAGGVPLDPGRVSGSHGANVNDPQGVLLADAGIELGCDQLRDVDLYTIWWKTIVGS